MNDRLKEALQAMEDLEKAASPGPWTWDGATGELAAGFYDAVGSILGTAEESRNAALAARAPTYSALVRELAEALEDICTRHQGPDWRDDPDRAMQAAVLRKACEVNDEHS